MSSSKANRNTTRVLSLETGRDYPTSRDENALSITLAIADGDGDSDTMKPYTLTDTKDTCNSTDNTFDLGTLKSSGLDECVSNLDEKIEKIATNKIASFDDLNSNEHQRCSTKNVNELDDQLAKECAVDEKCSSVDSLKTFKTEKCSNNNDSNDKEDPDELAKTLSFPAKLHAILLQKMYKDLISWMPHGRSWRVHKPKAFEKHVMPHFFKHCSYQSFIRQTNAWGFRRITKGGDRNSYYHENFLRGRLSLCQKLCRPGTFKKQKIDPENEPDFYQMSERDPLPEDCVIKSHDVVNEAMKIQQMYNEKHTSNRNVSYNNKLGIAYIPDEKSGQTEIEKSFKKLYDIQQRETIKTLLECTRAMDKKNEAKVVEDFEQKEQPRRVQELLQLSQYFRMNSEGYETVIKNHKMRVLWHKQDEIAQTPTTNKDKPASLEECVSTIDEKIAKEVATDEKTSQDSSKALFAENKDYGDSKDSNDKEDPDELAKTLSFPAKLHVILSQKLYKVAISWMPHGRSWRVHEPKSFEKHVMPHFFKHCSYQSFIRQTKAWGFRRITKGRDRNSYYHANFLRGRLSLYQKLCRPGTFKKQTNDSENEPDFYQMSEHDPLPEETIIKTHDVIKEAMKIQQMCQERNVSYNNKFGIAYIPDERSGQTEIEKSTDQLCDIQQRENNKTLLMYLHAMGKRNNDSGTKSTEGLKEKKQPRRVQELLQLSQYFQKNREGYEKVINNHRRSLQQNERR